MKQLDRHPEAARRLLVGVTAVAYAALVFVLPFIGDFGVPGMLVAGLWLGGSYTAGTLASWHLMAVIAIAAAVVFIIGIEREAFLDFTFFADPLSSMAIPPLAAGEILALYFGSNRMRSRRQRRVGRWDPPRSS